MSELGPPGREGRGFDREAWLYLARARIESGFGYPLISFGDGSRIRLDMSDEFSPDGDLVAFFEGVLVSARFGLVDVQDSSEQELIEERVVVGTSREILTPVIGHTEMVNLRGLITPKCSMMYIYEDDYVLNELIERPDIYHYQPYNYRRMTIGGEVVFDL